MSNQLSLAQRIGVGFGLVLSLFLGSAQANVLTTTFDSNNGSRGNMFDVNVLGGSLLFTGLSINTSGNDTLNVYTRNGTFVGHEQNAAGWNLAHSAAFASAGRDNPTFVDIADFSVGPGVTGLYVTVTGNQTMAYKNGTAVGNIAAANADLQILEGIGHANPLFTGSTFSPRIWNGSIHYTQNVPEPASLALLALGLAGLGFSRRRKA